MPGITGEPPPPPSTEPAAPQAAGPDMAEPNGASRDVAGRDGTGAARDGEVLLARLRAGDEQTFRTLVESWSPLMSTVARGFVPTDASAQEVVQDTWLAVIKGLDAFEGRCSLRTWVFAILVNIAKTQGVRDQRTTPQPAPADDDGPVVDPGRFHGRAHPRRGRWTSAGAPRCWDTDPEPAALAREVTDLVAAAVSRLPGRQREVVLLRDVHGFASAEVCELLGLTPQNQRVLLHRGRAKVRAALEAYYAEGRS